MADKWENGGPVDRGTSAYANGAAPNESPIDNHPWDEDDNPFHVYKQLTAVQYKVEWTKADVDSALRQHEMGMFQGSALLADSMTRDDAVTAVLDARVEGMLGLDRIITPASVGDVEGNKRITEIIRARFEEFFPVGVLAPLKRWEILMGFSIAQIIYTIRENEWVPQLDVWHPMFTYVRLDTHQYYVLTTEGPVEVVPGTGQWVLYAPRGTRYGWMNGAIRSIATPWLARAYTWRDWLRFNELWSLGIRKAVTPPNASTAEKKTFFGQIASLGSNTTVLTPKGKPGDGNDYDVDVLFPPGTGSAQSFETLLTKAESKIAIRINGQNLTTEVKGGSYAAAKVHENVKDAILQFDSASLGECLSKQVITPYIGFHQFTDGTCAPLVLWNTKSPDDIKQQAMGTQQISQALVNFQTCSAPVDQRALMQKFDIPVLAKVADAPDAPAQSKTPVAPAPAQPPLGENDDKREDETGEPASDKN